MGTGVLTASSITVGITTGATTGTVVDALAAAAAGVAILAIVVPVVTVGVIRGVNNSKVNNQIESRQTLLPVNLQVGEKKSLDMFFPLAPSPERVELTYRDSRGEHTLIIETKAALGGLHLGQAAE